MMNNVYLLVSVIVTLLSIPKLVDGLKKKGMARNAIAGAFMFLLFYGYLVNYSEESKRLFGSWLLGQKDKISVLADVSVRALVLAGIPILSVSLFAAFCILLHETESIVTRSIKKWAVSGLKLGICFAIITVFIVMLDTITKGNLAYVQELAGCLSWENILMYACMPGMIASFSYLIYEAGVVLMSIPDLVKLCVNRFHYKPKH